MAMTEKITNAEAYNKYVKMYNCNVEVARQFMADECVQGMEAVEKQWVNRFLSLRTNWAKLDRGKSQRICSGSAFLVAWMSS